ncbi:hypothetical protein ACTFIZ_007554 [Dictyostelium cf. discoideum]
MSTTVNNNEASSSSTSASNNAESLDLRMKSMEDQINNLSLAFTRFMKEPMFSSNTASRSQPSHDNSDTESEQSDDETSNDVDVPTEYQLSDTLLGQYKHMVNNHGLLVKEECILNKEEISEMNKVFNFPSNFSVNVAPFGTPDGISVSSNVKNNDTDLLIVEKRINDSLKPLLLMSSMLSHANSNVDLELIRYLAESAIVLAVNAQASSSFRFKKVKHLHKQPIIQDGRNQKSTVNGQTRILHGETRYQESLPPHVSAHYRWKTMPFGLSTAPRIFTMLLRPVLRMLRDINVSVIAYLDDLLIVGSTKEECLSNLKKTMELLVKLGFKLNLEKSVLEPTQSITFLGLQIDSLSMKLLVPKEKKKSVIKEIRNFLKLDCCSPRKLAGLKGKLIALKDAVIPFRLYTRRTNKFHSQCLTLANGDWDQSFPIPQEVKLEISHWLTVLNQWNGKEISLFPSYDYVLTTDASESGAGATLKKGNKVIKTWSFQWSSTQSNMSSNRREMLALLMAYQALWWSDTRTISSVRTTLETMPQEESQLDWRAYSRILQCKSRPPKPSFRDESQIIQSNQELQLATEERSVQPHPTSIRSNTDGSIRISPEPSNDQLLNNQNECTPPRLESMETMSGVPSTNTFAFYPGEDELVQFEEGFYNTDLSNLEISNMVSDDSSTSSSSSTSHVSSSSGYIPRSIDQTISRVNTNPNSTTLETGDYSTFQSHVKSIFGTQNSGTSELLMKSWEQSTIKVYNSSYTRFLNFCTLNSLDPSNITLVVFMDYLTHLFKIKPPLAFSTINNHRSMLNQLLLLRNQTDIVNDPFITRIMTGIHKLRPSSAKYKEIWDANKVFKYLSTIKVLPKFTYTALLNKTLVLCKMFGLARSSDLVKWSFHSEENRTLKATLNTTQI